MIDVSSYQENIDWVEVKAAGVQRAYIKFAEGMSIDPTAISHIHQARAAGVTIGLYYFAHPGPMDGVQAGQWFVKEAEGHILPGDLVPMLDLEVQEGRSMKMLATWKQNWFAVVDPVIKTLAGIYSDRYFINALLPYLKEYRPIWGAAPGGQLTVQEQGRWSYVQYGQGKVPGITGPGGVPAPVDLDRVLSPAVPVLVDPRVPNVTLLADAGTALGAGPTGLVASPSPTLAETLSPPPPES